MVTLFVLPGTIPAATGGHVGMERLAGDVVSLLV